MSNENQIAWVNIPHKGEPEIFGPFDNSTELMEWVQEYESSEKYNTVSIPDIKDIEGFFYDAQRQYHDAYKISCEEMIKLIKSAITYDAGKVLINGKTAEHLEVELIRIAKKFVFDNWYEEVRKDFIDGFKETYGSETRAEAEKDWDAWSNNIQGGADSLGFETELQGFASGKEEGELCKQMKSEQA